MGVVAGVVEGVIDRIHRVSLRVIENSFRIGGRKSESPQILVTQEKTGFHKAFRAYLKFPAQNTLVSFEGGQGGTFPFSKGKVPPCVPTSPSFSKYVQQMT